MPELAKRDDATGAANFVLYWVKVSNYAALTGDTALLRKISSPDCQGCYRYIDLYERTYRAGGYFKGGNRTLERVDVQEVDSGVYVSAHLAAAAGRYRKSKTDREHPSPPESTRVTFLAQKNQRNWVMFDIGLSGS